MKGNKDFRFKQQRQNSFFKDKGSAEMADRENQLKGEPHSLKGKPRN